MEREWRHKEIPSPDKWATKDDPITPNMYSVIRNWIERLQRDGVRGDAPEIDQMTKGQAAWLIEELREGDLEANETEPSDEFAALDAKWSEFLFSMSQEQLGRSDDEGA